MNRNLIAMMVMLVLGINAKAQIYSTLNGKVSFFSSTPMEDISALNSNVRAVLNTATNEFAVSITNTSFLFENKLMEEHFNEKYMESEKYPVSTFKGKINEKIDYSKDGEYKVTATGILNIHGVEVKRTISGTVVVKGETVQFNSSFKVRNADHKIQIPTIVTAKIAEEIDVKVDILLTKKK